MDKEMKWKNQARKKLAGKDLAGKRLVEYTDWFFFSLKLNQRQNECLAHIFRFLSYVTLYPIYRT